MGDIEERKQEENSIVSSDHQKLYTRSIAKAMDASLIGLDKYKLNKSQATAQLQMLKEELTSAVEISSHLTQKKTEMAKMAIDVEADRMKQNIKSAYTHWLSTTGCAQKMEDSDIINDFAEKIEKQKEKINSGGAGEPIKKLLVTALDEVCIGMFKTLFQEALEAMRVKKEQEENNF